MILRVSTLSCLGINKIILVPTVEEAMSEVSRSQQSCRTATVAPTHRDVADERTEKCNRPDRHGIIPPQNGEQDIDTREICLLNLIFIYLR